MRPIDADKLRNDPEMRFRFGDFVADVLCRIIDEMPTVKIESVPQMSCGKPMTVYRTTAAVTETHAKWIPINRGEKGYSAGNFRCSECGEPSRSWRKEKYCGNCGARMEI